MTDYEIKKNLLKKSFLPGHAVELHKMTSVEFPKQLVPLYLGTGLVHDLLRIFCPIPQDFEQDSNEPQDAQLPLTKKTI